MRYFLLGTLFILLSLALYHFKPAYQYPFYQAETLDELYGNTKKELSILDNGYDQEDLEEAKRWVKIHKLNSENTIEYIFQVCKLMFEFERGKWKTTHQYKGKVFHTENMKVSDSINFDCGQYSDFVSVFMMAENIPFRRVDAHYIPDTAIGAHSFQEIYIKEKDQWAFVDLTNDKILMQHRKTGDYVTIKDVMERVAANDYSNVEIYSFRRQNEIPLAWSENIVEEHKCFVPSIMLLYYNSSYKKSYGKTGDLKRKYLFWDWITHFNPPSKRNNIGYNLRLLFLYLGILILLVSLLLMIGLKKKK